MKRSPEFNVESQLFEKNINIIYGIGKGYIPNKYLYKYIKLLVAEKHKIIIKHQIPKFK